TRRPRRRPARPRGRTPRSRTPEEWRTGTRGRPRRRGGPARSRDRAAPRAGANSSPSLAQRRGLCYAVLHAVAVTTGRCPAASAESECSPPDGGQRPHLGGHRAWASRGHAGTHFATGIARRAARGGGAGDTPGRRADGPRATEGTTVASADARPAGTAGRAALTCRPCTST